jgi:ERCC4-type nuclease
MSVVAMVYVDDRENALDRNKKAKAKVKAGTAKKSSPVKHLESVFDADNREHSKKTSGEGGGVINYKITRLTVSDYCIVLRDMKTGKQIVVAAIERKRWKDLASTISGTRAETQPRDLRLAKFKYGCHIYYFAEGPFSYNDETEIGGKPFKSLHSKLRHETIRGIPFIQTKDPEHTVLMLVKMTRDFIKLRARKEISFPLQETPTNKNALLSAYVHHIRQINEQFSELASQISGARSVAVLTAIEDIDENIDFINLPEGPEDADTPGCPDVPWSDLLEPGTGAEGGAIPELFTKQHQAGNSDILQSMWTSIPGVTRNSAPLISETYTLLDLFACGTDGCDACDAKQEEIREMRFASGSRIGKQAEKIMANFRNDASCDATAIKVLCAIPRVTEPVAKVVIENYNMADLCNVKFKPMSLQDLTVGKRKIGPALAKKIVDMCRLCSKGGME